jgi:Asp-tRNA(Asn)/Glu-tRNA(Gln) amidotransferase A subunit family amidase
VAAGFAVAALGTETNGSITCPASMNGIVGIKPSIEVVSQQGVVPISFSQDTAGPMTKSVADAYLMLQAMRTDGNAQPNELVATTLQGKRIGILRAKMGYYPEVDAIFAEKVKQLTSAGVEVVDSLSFDTYPSFKQDSHIVLGVEFKHALNRYFASLPDPSLSQLTLGKLIEYNLEHKQTVMPFFGQEVFLLANQMPSIDAPMYLDARRRVQKASGVDGIDKLLSDNKLDAIIVPTTSPAWSIDKVLGDHYVGGFSDYPAIAGYPHVTMPLGKIQGLPFGLSITAGKGADEALLQLALAIEQL